MALGKSFYEHHVKVLSDKLADIYTIKKPDEYTGADNIDTINVQEELESVEALEKAYSLIEGGSQSGKIYEEYIRYLINIRSAKVILEKSKKNIEKEHADDITNAEILLKSFREHLE